MVSTKPSVDYTDHALASFFEHTQLSEEDQFYLIDNDGSYDRPIDESYTGIKRIVNPSPLSFAENANQALQIAYKKQADLFFLNNDLIFTEDWLEPLLVDDSALLSPLCNQQVQYQSGSFKLELAMELDDYLEHRSEFDLMMQQHRAKHSGYLNVIMLYFCCIKIPYSIYSKVGLFDPRK